MEVWKQFNDPVYGTVVLRSQRSGLKDVWKQLVDEEVLIGNLINSFSEIFNTVEFSRLNQLKQAGLTYLEFPSAVHTRLAHSWGCLYLGDQALSLVDVKIGKEEIAKDKKEEKRKHQYENLFSYLKPYGLADEFLIALLLHDIGHMPFSHLLEDSKYFSSVSHEEIGCQYILGKGSFHEEFRQKMMSRWGNGIPHNILFLPDVLSGIKGLDKGFICALITGNEDYIEKKQNKKPFRILVELVSGLLDLDRVDHYQRDILFTGLRIPSPDPVAIMINMKLNPSSPTMTEIRLDEMGILQARNLLQAKSTLSKYVFNNDHVLAYHTMLRHAVNMYIESNCSTEEEIQSVIRQLAVLTDEELIMLLKDSNLPKVRLLVSKLMNRQPYLKVADFDLTNNSLRNEPKEIGSLLIRCREHLMARYGDMVIEEEDILIAPPTGHYREKSHTKKWMDLSYLTDLEGVHIMSHPVYGDDFTSIFENPIYTKYTLRVYVSKKQLVEPVKQFFSNNTGLNQIY